MLDNLVYMQVQIFGQGCKKESNIFLEKKLSALKNLHTPPPQMKNLTGTLSETNSSLGKKSE